MARNIGAWIIIQGCFSIYMYVLYLCLYMSKAAPSRVVPSHHLQCIFLRQKKFWGRFVEQKDRMEFKSLDYGRCTDKHLYMYMSSAAFIQRAPHTLSPRIQPHIFMLYTYNTQPIEIKHAAWVTMNILILIKVSLLLSSHIAWRA